MPSTEHIRCRGLKSSFHRESWYVVLKSRTWQAVQSSLIACEFSVVLVNLSWNSSREHTVIACEHSIVLDLSWSCSTDHVVGVCWSCSFFKFLKFFGIGDIEPEIMLDHVIHRWWFRCSRCSYNLALSMAEMVKQSYVLAGRQLVIRLIQER